jgi:hypothetical protein
MKTKISLILVVSFMLVSCLPVATTSLANEIETPVAVTFTPAPTLPPTLTPIPIPAQAQATPTALYSPVALSPSDNEVYQKALSDIPVYRQGDLQITVVDQNGQPLPGYQIKYRQVSHDFNFGSVIYPAQIGEIRKSGINYWDFEMQWQWIQPQEDQYTFDFINYWQSPAEVKSDGFKTMGSALVLFLNENGRDIPPYWRGLSFDEFQEKLYNYVSATVKEFAPVIDVWEGISEPNFEYRNPLGLTKEQYYQTIATANRAIRENDPTAIIEINLGVPCGQIAWESDVEIVQGLLDRNIDFDQIGLQFYNNGYVNNGFYFGKDSLEEMSVCWDAYEKMLAPYGKKLNMTEMSVPSDHRGLELGYWDTPWTEDTQAQYLEIFYTTFFAKPTNTGLAWYFTIDTPDDKDAFVMYKGGLIGSDGAPKKSFYALQRLINEWTTTGSGVTDANGILSLRGFGGEYEIEVVNPNTGESMSAHVHITEQKSAAETIAFYPNQQLLEQKTKLEKLVAYWETQADEQMIQKGRDDLTLVNHHLQNAEWALAQQTLDFALDELAIITEMTIPLAKFTLANQERDVPIMDGGRAVIWGADTLYLVYDFPRGEVTVEVRAHSQSEKGEFPYLVTGVGANYSQMWKVENPVPEIYTYTASTTGDEQAITIRFPYINRINESVIAQNGNVGELKLFVDAVKIIITTAEIP